MLVDLLNRWVTALDLESLEKARRTLLSRLASQERDYLRQIYQPKELQFCRAYTRSLLNLGVHSTQRNESYHVVVKKRLNKNLSVSAACEAIIAKTKKLAEEYNERINEDRKHRPTLMDKKAFKTVGSLLTHWAIDKTMIEWRTTKDFGDAIDSGDAEPFEFDEAVGCQFECELPLRFRLPCKHWMLPFYLRGEPLPPSLFHPRWLLDGPVVVQSWRMSSSKLTVESTSPSPTSAVPFYSGNPSTRVRYQDDGVQLIIDSAARVVETLRSLPAGQKEIFASGFYDLTSKLQSRTSEIMASRQAMPAELPPPLPQPNVLFKANRRRGYTGREAAEEEEKEVRRALKQAEREGELQRIENEAMSQDLCQEHLARHEPEKVRRQESKSDDEDDFVPATYPPESSNFIQVPATTPTSTIRSTLRTSRKPTKRFESQNVRDIAAVELKEQHRRDREAKANRTGAGRTKKAETLAQTSQLLDGVELPFRSSQ